MEILIIILGIALDRITKLWALSSLSKISHVVIIENFFSLSYLENRGAAFGILQDKVTFLSMITLVIMISIIYYLFRYKPVSRLMRISLSLIVSGAIGNLIDRVGYKYVVDFIMFHYKDIYYFPTFNVADVLVVTGTALLAIYLIKEENDGK